MSDVNQLVQLSDYQRLREHIFPSASSLQWFVRTHKAALVQAEALLLLSGRWFANPTKFDGYMLTLGSSKAREAVS